MALGPLSPTPVALPRPAADDGLPPHEELVAGCVRFVDHCCPLGFFSRTAWIEALHRAPASASRLLVCCVLALSARTTAALVRRYGGCDRASAHFLGQARALAPAALYTPTLEHAQAFFLLSAAEWAAGDHARSAMDMGVAVRMAVVLKLHREETYTLPPTASADAVVQAEAARRTFWMIHSQEALALLAPLRAGQAPWPAPAPVPADAITARLPCNEPSFAFGAVVAAAQRALLSGPPLAHQGLFASLVQAHSLWRRAVRLAGRRKEAGGGRGEHHELVAALAAWEAALPPKHRWSVWNLRGWKAERLHLAYLSVAMVLRLAGIVARRVYLDEMVAMAGTAARRGGAGAADAADAVWPAMANDLFGSVLALHEQVAAYVRVRAGGDGNDRDGSGGSGPGDGLPGIVRFGACMCGAMALWLWRCPALCPHIAPAEAADMALSALRVLGGDYEQGDACLADAARHRAGGSSSTGKADVAAIPGNLLEAEVARFLDGSMHFGLLDWVAVEQPPVSIRS